ncbi:hypothetical protein JY651_40770 [Pyxidicoccus parkwayensis]|uniref:PEGA domain-containing protein n=1 Tax=Pyxidicoccus parkwayensis TaxID=2813578 RepID=A0ABX7NVF8_9BACT|nr:hypothetical protein [Pyxidicoccus parkwaysis]QSQ21457.1 hypothetical protein JY651_40770 [Pyxidicoccus parkwaysis]
MSLRWSLLFLSLSATALAEDGVTVRVRCPEKCTVVLDGKNGLRVTDSTWEFEGIDTGARRVEATGVLGRPLVSGFAEIPDVARADVFLTSNKRIAVERGSTSRPGTPKWAEDRKVPVKGGAKSVAIVRCPEDCTVLLDGNHGLRRDERTWEFKDVEPGRRRVEATASLFSRKLFLDYVDVPAGAEATFYGDSKGNVRLTEDRSLEAVEQERARVRKAGTSELNVRCQKPCTVSLDGARRGSSNATNVLLRDVEPGAHELDVVFTVGKSHRRMKLDVRASSETFITASEDDGFQVTNTKPLTP